MKKKKYLWRVLMILFFLTLIMLILVRDICLIRDCVYMQSLVGIGNILRFIFLTSLSIFTTTIFTFFISDKIFKKWLIFTVIYFAVTAFLVHISPTTMQGPLVGPTKGLVSMNLSWIFTVISLIMFIWMSVKEKK